MLQTRPELQFAMHRRRRELSLTARRRRSPRSPGNPSTHSRRQRTWKLHCH